MRTQNRLRWAIGSQAKCSGKPDAIGLAAPLEPRAVPLRATLVLSL